MVKRGRPSARGPVARLTPAPNRYVGRTRARCSSADGAANGNKGKQAHAQAPASAGLHQDTVGEDTALHKMCRQRICIITARERQNKNAIEGYNHEP